MIRNECKQSLFLVVYLEYGFCKKNSKNRKKNRKSKKKKVQSTVCHTGSRYLLKCVIGNFKEYQYVSKLAFSKW